MLVDRRRIGAADRVGRNRHQVAAGHRVDRHTDVAGIAGHLTNVNGQALQCVAGWRRLTVVNWVAAWQVTLMETPCSSDAELRLLTLDPVKKFTVAISTALLQPVLP